MSVIAFPPPPNLNIRQVKEIKTSALNYTANVQHSLLESAQQLTERVERLKTKPCRAFQEREESKHEKSKGLEKSQTAKRW